jgi:hypothetical protein
MYSGKEEPPRSMAHKDDEKGGTKYRWRTFDLQQSNKEEACLCKLWGSEPNCTGVNGSTAFEYS